MNILILGYMRNMQSGVYFNLSFEELGHRVEYIDIRMLTHENGIQEGQNVILNKLRNSKYEPDMILVLKGLELTVTTIKEIKLIYKKSNLVFWFPDIYVYNKLIWEEQHYQEVVKLADYFFVQIRGVETKMKEKGFNNVYFLPGACYPPSHEEQQMNNFQRQKYGEDISCCGTIGFLDIHKDRLKYLYKIIEEGFNINIWGSLIGEPKRIPLSIRNKMTGEEAINERCAMIYQSSLINLGLDGNPEVDCSWSVRLFRVLCAGGLYLSTPTKGLEEFFKVNKEGESITPDQDLVVFYNEYDMVKKIDFLLSHDEIRDSIRKNGQKKVLEKWKFTDMISEMLEVIKNE